MTDKISRKCLSADFKGADVGDIGDVKTAIMGWDDGIMDEMLPCISEYRPLSRTSCLAGLGLESDSYA